MSDLAGMVIGNDISSHEILEIVPRRMDFLKLNYCVSS